MRLAIMAAVLLGSILEPAQAAQYALLVGVGHYPALPNNPLEGPGPDVDSLKDVLSKRYGFQNIVVLKEDHATRQNILDALTAMVKSAAAGDRVLFYFSGHGTSAFDANLWQLADMIGPNSGALIPYDLKTSSVDQLGQSMIIGRRDIKPILSLLNKDALAWVILDSCYSENAARAVGKWAGSVRGVSLVHATGGDSTDRQADTGLGRALPDNKVKEARYSTESSEPYPYPNVISFSAASRNEPAEDINSGQLKAGLRQTIDGKPHGAFTNGLLQALNGDADTNHDGVITFDELFRYVKDQIHASQTPQMLPDQGDTPRLPVLAEVRPPAPPPAPVKPPAPVPAPPPAPAPAAPRVKVTLDGVDPALEARIRALPAIEIVPGGFDLLVRREQKQRPDASRPEDVLALYQAGPLLIREYKPSEPAELLARIAAQPEVGRLSSFRFPAQTFNLTVDADPVIDKVARKDFRAAIQIGQQAAISVSAEKPVYLLVLDIDKEGVISVLYPGPKDPQLFTKTTPEVIFQARAGAPAGAELVKAFGFLAKPEGFDSFACRTAPGGSLDCPTIMPGDASYRRLLAMLASCKDGCAEAHAALMTRE